MVAMHVYLEGGGPSNRTQSRLREGFDGFCRILKELAVRKDVSLRFIVAGSRDDAYRDFKTASKTNPERTNLLLVDSEERVNGMPTAHLENRDPWDFSGVAGDRVHLMAQCMEAWLVADPEAMADYYGQRFNRGALPKRLNLEEEPKAQIYDALKTATRQTQKGPYGKIKHASQLLRLVSPERAQHRFPHCRRFFDSLRGFIEN